MQTDTIPCPAPDDTLPPEEYVEDTQPLPILMFEVAEETEKL